MNRNFKLTIELVPDTSWFNNLRSILSKEQWDKIRKDTYKKYNYKCGICDAIDVLHCHEIWEYDDKKHIQKLKGFIALCKNCHNVKHIGYAEIQSKNGELNIIELINHFCKINNCTRREFVEYKIEKFEQWYKRSKYDWKLDIGKYKK